MLLEVRTPSTENGALVWAGGSEDSVLRLMPPLVITRDQMEPGLDIIAAVIESVTEARLASCP